MNTTTRTRTMFYRHKLLVTVSAAALLNVTSGSARAAGDADRPLIWIELGGQLSGQSGQNEPFRAPFTDLAEQQGLLPVAPLQKPPKYSLDEEASLSFQPENSDWSFAASIKYGRSRTRRHQYEQFEPIFYHTPNWQIEQYPDRNGHSGGAPGGYRSGHVIFGAVPEVDYSANQSERHVILDFQAGKDVGIGLFGHGSTSEIALGVRIAQLTSKSKLQLYADPYPHMSDKKYVPPLHASFYENIFDQYYNAAPQITRSFRGLGPSVSWNGSTPMINLGEDSDIAFDWGANVGLLFGKQKTHIKHQTAGTNWYRYAFPTSHQAKYGTRHSVHNSNVARSRNVTVPNVGGMAGLSLQFPNAKVSIGYRADFFFGALDGGIDSRKSETRGFHGPYVSISIGLGG